MRACASAQAYDGDPCCCGLFARMRSQSRKSAETACNSRRDDENKDQASDMRIGAIAA